MRATILHNCSATIFHNMHQSHIQNTKAANKMTAWAEKWCVNKEKTSTILSTLSSKQKMGSTKKMGNTQLTKMDVPTYLGATFDKKQTWKPHIT